MGASIGQTFLLEPAREEYVGEVRVNVRLENYVDWNAEQDGHLADESIRRVDVRMLVDTGAANLFLPRDIVETLGLRLLDRVGVEHTDGRTERLDVAGVVRLSVEGRTAEVRCIVGPAGVEPLLGQVPLEILDLLVDCSRQRLAPRPESPDVPFVKLK